MKKNYKSEYHKAKKLRSFVYLDNYKMHSFSSQIFEGLTEYIVKSESEKKEQSDSQNGPVGTGKILADIIGKDSSLTEKKFLHDYAYKLFEEALVRDGKVLHINKNNISNSIKNIKNYSFVKITGRVAFNDLKQIGHTISTFNSLGESLGYVTKKAAYDKELETLNETVNTIENRDQKARAKVFVKGKTDFKKVLKEEGLRMDENFIKHLAYLLDYGYNQQFEIQIPLSGLNEQYYLFSAQLNRENLKDNEFQIIKKFSRETEKEFVLFGLLTQIQTISQKKSLLDHAVSKVESNPQNHNLKEALMNMVSHLTSLEKTFTGKLDYEYIIDPISLYMEI